MTIRPYQPDDLDAMMQIHRDVGWSGDTDVHREAGRLFYDDGTTLVGLVDGAVEAFASNHDGVMRYLDDDLPLVVVGGVATSHVARRGGLATRLTAEAVAADVIEKGSAVSVLGVFDLGFYDRLGFGSGPYDHGASFDPAALTVPVPDARPVRLTEADTERMHANRAETPRRHGGICLADAAQTRADMLVQKDVLAVGFEDEAGALTHHVLLNTMDRSSGPWAVKWLAYREPAQLLELLGWLKGASDQIRSVRMIEPSNLRLWDLLDRPWRRQNLTAGSKFEARTWAASWWQVRILDIEACVAAARLPVADPVRFNLVLDDPIAQYLAPESAARWSGIGGAYVIALSEESRARRSDPDPSLPTMRTGIATFSRLWLGAQHANGLALTCPDLDAPPELLAALERVLRLPTPQLGWDI